MASFTVPNEGGVETAVVKRRGRGGSGGVSQCAAVSWVVDAWGLLRGLLFGRRGEGIEE